MVEVADKRATYADLLAVPEPLVAEILFGRLITQPRPVPRHSGAAAALIAVVGGPFQFGIGGPGGWVFLDEPELHLGAHVLVPDIAGWRRDRLQAPDKAYIEVAPDWICEVLSPRTEKFDKGDKQLIYAEHEVEHVWHVDPRVPMLETYARQGRSWLVTGTHCDDDKVRQAPFADVEFALDLLWPFDRPTSAA